VETLAVVGEKMAKYKLKIAARQFFDKKFHDKVEPLDYWHDRFINATLLDEVEKVFVELGHQVDDVRTDISGWRSNHNEPKALFYFTVNVMDITSREYDQINRAEVLDEIQAVLNRYFKESSLD
jgi:hypothetical protein